MSEVAVKNLKLYNKLIKKIEAEEELVDEELDFIETDIFKNLYNGLKGDYAELDTNDLSRPNTPMELKYEIIESSFHNLEIEQFKKKIEQLETNRKWLKGNFKCPICYTIIKNGNRYRHKRTRKHIIIMELCKFIDEVYKDDFINKFNELIAFPRT